MGKTLQNLSKTNLSKKTIFDKRIVLECCETFHLHWRNFRLEFSFENYKKFIKMILNGHANWISENSPEKCVHFELGRNLLEPSLCTPDQFKIELCDNLYKHHEGSKDSEFLEEDDFIHIHYRDLRMEMSRDEFVELAEKFLEARNNLVYKPKYSLPELFDILDRHNIIYIVMRDWENLPNHVHFGPESDIDLLVHPLHIEKVKHLWNLEPVYNEPHRVKYKCNVLNDSAENYFLCDIRTTTDGYYPEDFANRLLNKRVKLKNFYIIPPAEHFYALLYHAIHHKGMIHYYHRNRLRLLSHILGIKYDQKHKDNFSFLDNLLKKQNINFAKPLDKTVLPALPFLKEIQTVIYSRHLTDYNGIRYQSRIYKFEDADKIRIIKQATEELAEREFQILSSLNSKYFPKVFSVNRNNSYSSFEMEFIDGYLLEDIENHLDEWDNEKAKKIIGSCISILKELDAKNILHRDIKPDNIFVRNFEPVLMDFAWALQNNEEYLTPDGLGSWTKLPGKSFSDAYSMGLTLLFLTKHFPQYYPVIKKLIEYGSSGTPIDYEELFNMLTLSFNKSETDCYNVEIENTLQSVKPQNKCSAYNNDHLLSENSIQSCLEKAEVLIENRDLYSAKSLLLDILELNPNNLLALNDLVVILILEDNYVEAETLLERILSTDPNDEAAKENLIYLQEIKYRTTYRNDVSDNSTTDTLSKVIENQKSKKEINEYVNKIPELLKDNRFFKAYRLIDKLRKFEDEKNLAEYSEILEKQRKELKGKIGWNSKVSAKNLIKAEELIEKKKLAEAREKLEQIIDLEPTHIEALNDLSVVNIFEENYNEAYELIDFILTQEPENEIALGNLRYLKEKINRGNNMLGNIEKIKQSEELINVNNLLEAEKLLCEVLNDDNNNLDALNNLSVIKILNKNYNSAKELITDILLKEPTNEVALDNLKYLSSVTKEINEGLLPESNLRHLDNPIEGVEIAGKINIYGWLLTDTAEECPVYIYVDDQRLEKVERGGREDVHSAYPDYAQNNPLPGFGTWLDTVTLENGEHTIRCFAMYQNNLLKFAEAKFVVNNQIQKSRLGESSEQNFLGLSFMAYEPFRKKYDLLQRLDYQNIKKEKIKLIAGFGEADSIRDFGGLWGVHGLYLLEGAKHLKCKFAEMVDVTPRPEFDEKIKEYKKEIYCKFSMVQGDFRDHNIFNNLSNVDISLLYEVILHQENHVDVIRNVISKTDKCVCFAQPVMKEEMFILPNGCVNLQFYPEELKDILRYSGWWVKEPVVDCFDTRFWMWGQTTSYIESIFNGFGWELSYSKIHDMSDHWDFCLLRFVPKKS